ncbi:MAG: amino acid ABC transporter substrate-binding protein [Limnohabitans sp.]|nr:amino acid ABC transporter substrate-binding protein [Limnohabitans sp.]
MVLAGCRALSGLGLCLVLSSALAQTPLTLERVKASGQIAVGYRESSVPFSYLDGSGLPTGFSWEICGRIVEQVKRVTGRADLKVTPVAVTSQNRIPLLQNGTLDIECGSTTNNSERAKQVAFAINYFYTGTRFLVNASSGVQSLDDLKGKRVVSTTGSTNYQIMRNLNARQNLGIELLGARDHSDSFLMVQQGRADAFAMDDVLLYGLKAGANNPAQWAVVGEPIQVEPYAIMLRKDDAPFKQLVDGVLTQLMKGSEFESLYKKWFQSPVPPKGINLNAPMSKDLQTNLKELSDRPAL